MDEIERFAEQGLVTRKKLIDERIDADAIDYRVRVKSLFALQRGVYRFRGVPESFEVRARAACLYTGEEGAISHAAAAHLHGIEDFKEPTSLEMLVPSHLQMKPSGVLVHSTDEPFQSIKRDGIRYTSLPRTLIDVADHLSMDEVEKVLNAVWRNQRNIGPWLRQEIAKLKRKE